MRCEIPVVVFPRVSVRTPTKRRAWRWALPVTAAAFVAVVIGCEPAPKDDASPYEPTPFGIACRGNNDGVITADEMPFVVGAKARFRITGAGDVNVEGVDVDGVNTWDLTRPDPALEPLARMGPEELDEKWFASSFPEASLAGPLDPGLSSFGGISADEDGAYLHGFASADDDEVKTLAVYNEPAVLYPFPLQVGARQTSVVTATNAMLVGLQTAFEDTYDIEVTDIGTLKLPDLVLHNTLKVTVRFSRVLLAGDIQQVTHIFVHECLGEVARVRSPLRSLSETIDDDFTSSLDTWRLAL